jgi:sialate O-acetylesterase
MKTYIILSFTFLLFSLTLTGQTPLVDESAYSGRIRVACIGNSVTYGYGLEDRDRDSYPARLQFMLGDKYEVRNFGYSGATLLKKGHKPYREKPPYREALDFQPHIVVIHLGLNDTDPRNWAHFKQDFISDYSEMIDVFRSLDTDPGPSIWICKMTPIFSWHRRFKTGTRDDFWAIQEAIEKVAANKGVSLIDLHTPLHSRPDLFEDALHPSEEGAEIIASTVKSYVTGDFGGLSLSPLFTDHMVLQRDQPVRIFGSANAGEQVVVKFSGKELSTTTSAFGHWLAEFAPMSAGGPYDLTVSAEKSILIRDILVGEVWLCSGQSNMAFPMKREMHYEKEIPGSDLPEIRLFNFNPVAWPGGGEFTQEAMQSINKGEYFIAGPWKSCSQESVSDFSAVAYYFGKELYNKLGVPIGLIHNAVGGSNTESWISRKTLEFHPEFTDMLADWLHNEQVQAWCRTRAAENLLNAGSLNQQHPFAPAYLFGTGIVPLENFPFRGVIWYQGESNAEQIEQHEELFTCMVSDWRRYFDNQEMPFYYVQLSSLNRETWPEFRDSQRRLMTQIPHTGMAVTSDIGHPTDVHPKNKKKVGHRLSLWALSQTYGQAVEYSGPLYRSMEIEKNKIRLYFDHTGSGLSIPDNQKIMGFEIAEEDHVYHHARAKIKKNHVVVTGKGISHPKYVRYGWEPYSLANLFNDEGLPASTFSTEGGN